jgi:hypothetical protein
MAHPVTDSLASVSVVGLIAGYVVDCTIVSP